MLKDTAAWLHRGVSRAPGRIPEAYLRSVSLLSRHCLPPFVSSRLMNSVCSDGTAWPPIAFAEREVVVGRSTCIRLVPHLGEFDRTVLFSKSLDYERATFVWLEVHAAETYDRIIEIGANVGVFTVFFNQLIKTHPGARLKSIVAFEPSQEAYSRLMQNCAPTLLQASQPFGRRLGKDRVCNRFLSPRTI